MLKRELYEELGEILITELLDDLKYKSLRKLAPGGSVSDDQVSVTSYCL